MEISLVFEDNIYKVKVPGELTYNYSSISKVEEMFGADMAAYFADAIREACSNNGLIAKVRSNNSVSDKDVVETYFKTK